MSAAKPIRADPKFCFYGPRFSSAVNSCHVVIAGSCERFFGEAEVGTAIPGFGVRQAAQRSNHLAQRREAVR